MNLLVGWRLLLFLWVIHAVGCNQAAGTAHCQDDLQCPQVQGCDVGICHVKCQASTECSSDQVCVWVQQIGFCRKACHASAECLSEELCISGACTPINPNDAGQDSNDGNHEHEVDGGVNEDGASFDETGVADEGSPVDVCKPINCDDRCGVLPDDGCGRPLDCGCCKDVSKTCDETTQQCLSSPPGLNCSGDPAAEGECQFGVNPCRWSCYPPWQQVKCVYIPACCEEIRRTGDPYVCCFDARRVCTPEQCSTIPDGADHGRCAQMWANGCCPNDSPQCPL